MKKNMNRFTVKLEGKYNFYTELTPEIIDTIAELCFYFPSDKATFADTFSEYNIQSQIGVLFHEKDRDIRATGRRLAVMDYLFNAVVDSGSVIGCSAKWGVIPKSDSFFISRNSPLNSIWHDTDNSADMLCEELLRFTQNAGFMPNTTAITEFAKKYLGSEYSDADARVLVSSYYRSNRFRAIIESLADNSLKELESYNDEFEYYSIKRYMTRQEEGWYDNRDIRYECTNTIQYVVSETILLLRGRLIRNTKRDHYMKFRLRYADDILAFGNSMAKFFQRSSQESRELLSDTKDILALIGREAA